MRVIILVIFFSFISKHCYGAFEFKETGAQGIALGGAYSARSEGSLAPYWNPAGLGFTQYKEISTFYSKLYSSDQLSYLGTSLSYPLSFGSMALSVNQFGPKVYREFQTIFSYSLKFQTDLSFGVNGKIMKLQIEDFGSTVLFGIDTGLIAKLNKNIRLSLVVKNVNRPGFGHPEELLPQGYVLGFAFKPVPKLWLSSDYEKIDPYEVLFRTGAEFSVNQYFHIRGGLRTNPTIFSLGFGLSIGLVRLDYSYTAHGILPGSHQISTGLLFGHSRKENVEDIAVLSFSTPTLINEIALPERESAIDLNQASKEMLMSIKGIGPSTAERIIQFRKLQKIKSLDDLLKIPGMRKDIFKILKKYLITE